MNILTDAFLMNCWYVAAWDHELIDGKLMARTLLEQPVLLYKGDSGKAGFWTELFYRTSNESAWALYMPPWNPNGRWFGVRDAQHEGAVTGLIPFDTFYTGGETHYGFTTVAVHTKYGREAIGGEKANTTVDSHAPQLFIASDQSARAQASPGRVGVGALVHDAKPTKV